MAIPLVANRFHLITPSGLVVNPVLLLPIAVSLYAGLTIMSCGWFLPPLAQTCGWICDRLLTLVDWIVGLAHQWPGGHAWTSGPPSWSVALFYCGTALLVAYPPTRLSRRWQLTAALAWVGG